MAEAKKIERFSYKIKKIRIKRLKGVKEFELAFGESNVTALLGVNGCGKSTILHALACVYRPHEKSAREYNKLSDFFKTNTDADWNGSFFQWILNTKSKIEGLTHLRSQL